MKLVGWVRDERGAATHRLFEAGNETFRVPVPCETIWAWQAHVRRQLGMANATRSPLRGELQTEADRLFRVLSN